MSFDEERAHVGGVDAVEFGAPTEPAHVDWRDADRALRRLARQRARLDADEARWLLIARRVQVHVELGLGSFLEYVERVLGYRPRTALERLRVAEALEQLPALRAALTAGSVSYSATRELTRVATPDTEDAWLAAAAGKTMREIEALVAGHVPGDRPDDPDDPSLEPRVLRLALTPEAYGQFLAARRAVEDDAGGRLDDSAVVEALCRAVVDGPAQGPAPASATVTRARHQLAITICARCDRATHDVAGQSIDLAPAARDRACCDATRVTPSGETTADIPRRVRRLVERRDRGRCTVPGCRASRHLEMHHVTPRARGGLHVPSCLTLQCDGHHRAAHAGTLVISGVAPDLRFTHADGRPYGADVHDVAAVAARDRGPRGEVVATRSADAASAPDARFSDARRALRTLGFSAGQAARSLDEARAHVEATTALPEVIRAALRACPRPG